MKPAATANWVLGAVALIVVVLVLGFLFSFQPNMNAKADAEDQARLIEDEISLLETNIARMQAIQREEPALLAQKASVQLDLPPQPRMTEFYRMIDAAFIEFDIPLIRVEFGVVTPVTPVFAVDEPAPASETGSTDPNAGPTPAPTPAPTPETPAPTEPVEPQLVLEGELIGLYAVPVVINAEGSLQSVVSLMGRLQGQQNRFFTIDSFDIVRATPTEDRDKRPGLTEDEVEAQIRGLVFMLWDNETSFTPDEIDEIPPYIPGDDLDDFFAPLDGAEQPNPR